MIRRRRGIINGQPWDTICGLLKRLSCTLPKTFFGAVPATANVITFSGVQVPGKAIFPIYRRFSQAGRLGFAACCFPSRDQRSANFLKSGNLGQTKLIGSPMRWLLPQCPVITGLRAQQPEAVNRPQCWTDHENAGTEYF